MTELGFKMFDTDHHYYEATDAFTRHMDPNMAPRAIQWADIDGHQTLIVGGKVNHFFANPTCDPTWKPESLLELMRGNNPDKLDFLEVANDYAPARPDFFDRDKRIELMDDQGIEGIISFPSLAMGMEEELASSDPEACVAAFSAFNRWIDDDWGFNYQDRICAPPVITLVDPDAAVKELEWALARGARMVAMRPGPVAGPGRSRSPGDRIFDPFWARVNDAGIAVGYHGGLNVYQSFLEVWGEAGGFDFQESPFMEVVGFFAKRAMSDTIAALICHGVFDRFPNVRVCTVENGSDWVMPLLKELKRVSGMLPKAFASDPVETFIRHVWISCTPCLAGAGEMLELRDEIGVSNLMMGSDYPHAEGLERPGDFVKELSGFSAEETKMIMRDNGLAIVQPAAI
jgi:predicted TIM-barrel fold metal-dependent hydrolase